MKVSKRTPGGEYRLSWVRIEDTAGISVEYEREVDTWVAPPGAQHSDHSYDFSVLDFVVDNPTVDDVAPNLVGIAMSSDDFFDGEKVVLDYDAQDPTGLHYVRATYERPDGTQFNRYDYSSNYGTVDPPDGKLDIDSDWEPLEVGTYTLISIMIEDRLGNNAFYKRNGQVSTNWGARQSWHEVDFTLGDFTIQEWPYSYSDVAGRGMINLDTASKKFRFQPSGLASGPGVRTDENMSVTNGIATIRYVGESLSVAGTFKLDSGQFTAVVQRGNSSVIHLVRAV
jgi:hypothetical protein